jgi:hypothetical protein
MPRTTVAAGALVATLGVLALTACHRAPEHGAPAAAIATSPATAPSNAAAEDFLFGRVITDDGITYEGRLRWGGDQEALWGNYFNAVKDQNPWAADVPPDRLTARVPLEILGVKIASREREIDLGRPFMARFGDIARIEAQGRELRVILKSGTAFDLDRYAADDFADGVRVWDVSRGVVDLDEWKIRSIELLPTPPSLGSTADRLHGTVRTRGGAFTGFIQWDREQCLSSDELHGRSADGELSLPFSSIRFIARRSRDSSLVTLVDGREIVHSESRGDGNSNRGIYVDDQRYGRVLISWDAFERLDFSPGGSGPAYGDFPPGGPITGSVVTRSGRRLAGRLVYDLDESETTETLDAPLQGIDYTIPFGLVASIVLPGLDEGGAVPAKVTLHGGEELPLERSGDLGARNAGMLIFPAGSQRPEYIAWSDVAQVDFDRPSKIYPPSHPR